MAKSAEFILNPALQQILVMDPHGPPTARIIERYRDDPVVQLVECSSSSDTISIARQLTACLIFIHARNHQDFVQHSLVLKALQAQIRKKSIRVVLTTAIKSTEMLARFTAAGCAEVLSETIGAKQLQFKIDRLLKGLPRSKASGASEGAADQDGTGKASSSPGKRAGAQAAAEAVEKEAGTVKLEKPLDIKGDCWLLQGGSAKRVAGRWLMRFRGPMPDQGKWMVAPPGVVPGAKADVWEWKPAYPEGVPFTLDEGRWYFVGQRPDFQNELWILVGRDPQLAFYSDGKEIGYKAKLNDLGSLLVSKDSGLAVQLVDFLRKARNAARKKTTKQVEEEEIRRSQEAIKRKRAEAAARGDAPEKGESFEIEEDDPTQPADAPAAVAKKRRRKVEVIYVAALKLNPRDSDIWLIELNRPRMAGGNWVMETQGPTLQDGTWIDRSPSAAPGTDHLWQWVPTGNEQSDRGWMLTGLQPRYSNGVWTMTGSRPSLVYRQGEERLGVKFETLDNGSLSAARDSDFAMRTFEAALAERKRRKANEEDEDEGSILKSKQEKQDADEDSRFGSTSSPEADAPEDKGTEFGEGGDGKDPEHRFALAHFGDVKGKWEHVTAMATGGRMYAFIPRALREGEITEIRQMPAFWTYVGPSAPRKTGGHWIFVLNEPERGVDFDALQAPAQAYFRGFTSRDGVISPTISVDGPEFRDSGTAAEGDEPSATQEGLGVGKEMSATQAAAPAGPMLEATQDGPAAGAELSATQAGPDLGKELSANQAGAAESPELSATQAAQSESPELSANQDGTPAGPALESPSGVAPSRAHSTGPLSPAAAKLRAGADPALPVISPLALAFLVSELMRKPDMDRKEVGRRYCAYVSSSCAGLRTEIWISRSGGWECAATVDGGPGRCRPAVEAGEGLQSMSPAGKGDAEPTWVSLLRNEAGQLIGALVIGGRGADRMKQEYAKASAQMAYGLMLAYQEAA